MLVCCTSIHLREKLFTYLHKEQTIDLNEYEAEGIQLFVIWQIERSLKKKVVRGMGYMEESKKLKQWVGRLTNYLGEFLPENNIQSRIQSVVAYNLPIFRSQNYTSRAFISKIKTSQNPRFTSIYMSLHENNRQYVPGGSMRI